MAKSKITLTVALETFNARGLRTAHVKYVNDELHLYVSASATMPGFVATFRNDRLAAEYLLDKSAKYTFMRLWTGKF